MGISANYTFGMRFKGRLIKGLLAVLALSLIPVVAFSAQKVITGADCKLYKQKINYQNKIFTCVKSGKNLVWSKGVVVKKSTPTTSPTPSLSLTPTPTLTANPSSSPRPAISSLLPSVNSSCEKIGQKIATSFGFLKCIWPGGTTSKGFWSRFEINKISTSKSNSYETKPLAAQPCKNSGDTYDVEGGYLECRWVHGKKLQWIKINFIHRTFVNAVSPQGIDLCKLQNADAAAQTGRNSGAGKAGFPMDRTTKNGMDPNGINNVLIVGVDFPELRGGSELTDILNSDTKWMLDWYRYFSGGKATFNVSTIDHWIHSSRSAESYNRVGNDYLSENSNRFLADTMQPFVDLITKEIDLRKFKTIYMMFPDGETTFMIDPIVRNESFNIKEGQTNLNFFGWWHDLEMMETMRWAFYIHETIHDFGVIGHAPGNGWGFGIMQNQSGISMAMNPYEGFLLDWLPEKQIYCQDAKTLTKTTVSLTPLEREDNQTKMAIIKLSSTRALVIESHGIDKWSSFNKGDRAFPPGFYSVMAYEVDLNKVGAPSVSSDARSLPNDNYAWAVWQLVEGGKSTNFPRIPVAHNADIFSAVAVLGDSFFVDGIRVKFVGTGDFETIEISKE